MRLVQSSIALLGTTAKMLVVVALYGTEYLGTDAEDTVGQLIAGIKMRLSS